MIIQDPLTGVGASVDDDNRLNTHAVTLIEAAQSNLDGTAFNINTGNITLTSANESALFYIKNNEESDYVIPRVFAAMGDSTSGTGYAQFTTVRNPTAGTLVSSGTALSPVNFNFGSSRGLTADVLKGVEGSTLTDGETLTESLLPSVGTRLLLSFDTSIVVPRGSSLAIKVTPPSGNTSMVVQVGCNIYKAISQ